MWRSLHGHTTSWSKCSAPNASISQDGRCENEVKQVGTKRYRWAYDLPFQGKRWLPALLTGQISDDLRDPARS